MYKTTLSSPIGKLYLTSDGTSLTSLWLEGQKYISAYLFTNSVETPNLPVFLQTERWLNAYFAKLPLPALPPMAPVGTPFRQEVWKLLLTIPYGQTTTYGILAQQLKLQGISASAQAVGGAVGHNPISLLIPCHRVIGANGNLTGYASGLERKRFLLEHESALQK